jgi:DNA polymerase-3 subunit delta
MIVKYFDLKNKIQNKIDYYLFYGPNTGLMEEIINEIFKPNFTKNIINYDENEVLNDKGSFLEELYNKSFFDNEKFIIINRATNKIYEIIQKVIESKIENLKIIIKANILEKKSKLRNYFEKEKNIIITAFYEDNYSALYSLAQKFFKKKSIQISNENINLIVERSKGNRATLNNELEKISLYSIDKKKINTSDVLKLSNLIENYDISELVNYCLSKNKRKTINILNENKLSIEENILVQKTFLNKLKRLKLLKVNIKKNKDIDKTLLLFKPAIFWKEKEHVKKQLQNYSLNEIKKLTNQTNNLELLIKKNSQISDQILSDFILEIL